MQTSLEDLAKKNVIPIVIFAGLMLVLWLWKPKVGTAVLSVFALTLLLAWWPTIEKWLRG